MNIQVYTTNCVFLASRIHMHNIYLHHRKGTHFQTSAFRHYKQANDLQAEHTSKLSNSQNHP